MVSCSPQRGIIFILSLLNPMFLFLSHTYVGYTLHKGKQYIIFNSFMSHTDAAKSCASESPRASLLEIDDQAEYDFIVSWLGLTSPADAVWLGYTIDAGTVTKLSNGMKLSPSNFGGVTSPGAFPYREEHPNLVSGCLQYVVRSSNAEVHRYSDVDCRVLRRFVCERDDFVSPTAATRAVTTTGAVTLPTFEKQEGYVINTVAGLGYKLFDLERMSFASAEAACASDNGNSRLAFPLDQGQLDFLRLYLAAYSAANVVWLGGDMTGGQLSVSGGGSVEGFVTSSGSYLQPPFAKGEPQTEGCVTFQVETGLFLGRDCTLRRAYICEISQEDIKMPRHTSM